MFCFARGRADINIYWFWNCNATYPFLIACTYNIAYVGIGIHVKHWSLGVSCACVDGNGRILGRNLRNLWRSPDRAVLSASAPQQCCTTVAGKWFSFRCHCASAAFFRMVAGVFLFTSVLFKCSSLYWTSFACGQLPCITVYTLYINYPIHRHIRVSSYFVD